MRLPRDVLFIIEHRRTFRSSFHKTFAALILFILLPTPEVNYPLDQLGRE